MVSVPPAIFTPVVIHVSGAPIDLTPAFVIKESFVYAGAVATSRTTIMLDLLQVGLTEGESVSIDDVPAACRLANSICLA